MGAKITILVAQTIKRPEDPQQSIPTRSLDKLFSHGTRKPQTPEALEDSAVELFGVAYPENTDPPVGAIAYFGETGEPVQDWCMCVDLVHLQPRGDQLYLFAGEELAIRPAERETLLRSLQDFYAGENWRFQATASNRWYLFLTHPPAIRTHSLTIAKGRDVDSHLPFGADEMEWHRKLNEVQMLFHDSPVNRQREARDELSLNSLWFWGGGRLPKSADAVRWDHVFTDEPLFKGLGRLTGAHLSPVPDTIDRLMALSSDGEASLVTLGDLWSDSHAHDPRQHATLLSRLDQDWIAGSLAAVTDGRIERITLIDPIYGEVSLTRRQARSWWRRIHQWTAYL